VKLHLISFDDPSPPPCPMDGGVVNRGNPYPGLTPDGEFAVREMMRECMLLDIDHMSMASQYDLLGIGLDAGYPINSGHNNVRSATGGLTERQLVPAQYATLKHLGGMAGVGGARIDHASWLREARAVLAAMGDGGVVGFGTDSDGVSPLMAAPAPGTPPVVYSSSYPMSTLGSASWDYNDAGVVHYGMLSDFVHGLMQLDGGPQLVDNMMHGAQAFRDSWALAESRCSALATSAVARSALESQPQCPVGTSLRAACGVCLQPRDNCPVCDGGTSGCLPEPTCPAGRTRNAWGVCSAKPAPEDRLEAPLATKLSRSGPKGFSLAPGRYTLSVTGRSGTEMAFTLELAASSTGLTLKGKHERTSANGGFARGLWTLQWVVGKRVLMLLARPEPGRPLQGAFALHQQGAATVTGRFKLEAGVPPKGAQELERLRELVEKL
jgi:hypothetical protein